LGAPPTARFGERIVIHNLLVSAGTLSAGVLGFGFQAVVSHRVPPEEYGAIVAVLTLLTLIGLPASALTLLMAREASRDRATGQHAASAAMLHEGNRILLCLGLALAIVAMLATPLLSRFLNIPVNLLLAAAVGLPFVLAFPLLIGDLQGQERFLAFSALAAGQAALKLLAAIGFGIAFGPIGIVLGISFASALSYLWAHALLRRKLGIKARAPWHRPAIAYLGILLPSTLALSVLLSADVLLVKHFFAQGPAGEYAAVVALSRALYYGAAGVAIVLFPKVVLRRSQGLNGAGLVWLSLGLVIGGGTAGLLILTLGSRFFLTAFAGALYAGGAAYLPWYAAGMTFLGAAAVLIATHQSRERREFLAIVISMAAIEPIAITVFHSSLLQVAQVVDGCMAALLLLLIGLYLQERGTSTTPAIIRQPGVGLVPGPLEATL
jgi:O-antigen/teichoic acid export membrane protein